MDEDARVNENWLPPGEHQEWFDPATNLHCLAFRTPMGHYCGYVGVDGTSPLYQKDYDDLGDIDVHGGLTFSGWRNFANEVSIWFFGFDCAHADDNINKCDLNFVISECTKLAKQISDLHK